MKQCPRGHNEQPHDERAQFCAVCGARLTSDEYAIEDEPRYALEADDEGVWALDG